MQENETGNRDEGERITWNGGALVAGLTVLLKWQTVVAAGGCLFFFLLPSTISAPLLCLLCSLLFIHWWWRCYRW
jgi:hypothetical protein